MSKLTQHIAKLRAQSPEQADDALVFWGTAADKPFLPQLKGCVGSVTTYIRLEPILVTTTVRMYCKQKRVTRVISTSVPLLKKLLNWDKRKAPSLANYAGSYFSMPGLLPEDSAIEVVFISPLKQLVTVPYGPFMARRLISKLTKQDRWFIPPSFSWRLLTPELTDDVFLSFSQESCFLISIDIETFKENATIRCLSYTAFFYDSLEPSGLRAETVVLPMDSDYALAVMRKFNWELKAPKVFQNGKYDISYLARYNAPVYGYYYDTANLFHSWYSELPKNLGFLNAFFNRQAVYWKDLAETNDLFEYYKYNALDTYGTGCAFLAMLLEAPAYALDNYTLEFPTVFPCHMAEMRGIARDMSKLEIAKAEQDAIIAKHTNSLNVILGVPEGQNFNVNSPIQMKQLLAVLGCKDLKSADEKNLQKARFRHPFNARILALVIKVRKARKLVSTYITPGKEFTRMDGTGHRILCALNPHGTDTARLAAKEHHFWCGLQLQNINRGPIVKQTFVADEGFELCEVDLAQAESRDTAYISGDATLIENVEYSPDFHCSNASAFFGVPFEEMYDIATGTVLNKPLRQIGKPVNHGANYNMGAYVLIDTMGEEKVYLAKKLLGLPRFWSMLEVADYLLEQFHKTYPGIRGTFYQGVVQEILKTRKLTSMAVHHEWFDSDRALAMGEEKEVYSSDYAQSSHWTRYCFGHPEKSKPHLNAYIAHPPQNLNAMTLNKAWVSVFFDIAIEPKYRDNFKLHAQIHDSILFQHRIGHDYLKEMVVARMQIPVTIKAYDGKIRTFIVPADASKSGKYWSDLK